MANIEVKKEDATKWALCGVSAIAGLYYLGPMVLAAVHTGMEIAFAAVLIAVVVFTYPAFCEFLASLGWSLYEKAIRQDPVSRLNRDEEAFRAEIDSYEEDVGSATAAIDNVAKVVNTQANALAPEKLEAFRVQLKDLENVKMRLEAERDTLVEAYNTFMADKAKALAEYEVSNAFAKSLAVFKVNKKVGKGSQGSKIAFNEIEKRLAESQARLKLAMSRPKLTF